jgi:DNA-binding NarL/FixJ family response regulator
MIRTIVVDDHRLVRIALRRLLEDTPNISVVGEAETGKQALSLVRELRPDVVLMDILMPGMGGLEATQRITRGAQAPAVIALSDCAEQPFPGQMLKAGAVGSLTKSVDAQELVLAIKRVFSGKRYLCNEMAQDLASYAYQDNADSPFDTLSHREMQIMMMVIGCQKVSEISLNLHLSPKTVNSYRYQNVDKLKVKGDVELVLLAVKHGIVQNLARSALPAPPHKLTEQERTVA